MPDFCKVFNEKNPILTNIMQNNIVTSAFAVIATKQRSVPFYFGTLLLSTKEAPFELLCVEPVKFETVQLVGEIPNLPTTTASTLEACESEDPQALIETHSIALSLGNIRKTCKKHGFAICHQQCKNSQLAQHIINGKFLKVSNLAKH
jgi:hypothetical protein